MPGLTGRGGIVTKGEGLVDGARELGEKEEAAVLRILDDRQVGARERFISLLRNSAWELQHFSSPGVLCDVLMTQAAGATADEPSPNALRISVACYVFDRLCDALGASYAHTMRKVRDEMFSGIFADLRSEDGDESVQFTAQGAHVPAAMVQYGLSAEASAAHRYVGAPMHFEHALRYRMQLGRSARVCTGLARSFSRHQLVLDRACDAWQRALLHRVFWFWRAWHRSHVQEKWIKHRRRGRYLADLEERVKESVFLRWRLSVEKSRSRRLMEREDTLVSQLGNAKNQFTLQCFKTERYLITIEELRKQLAEVTLQLAQEKRKNVDAHALLNVEHNKRVADMNEHLTAVAKSTEQWVTFTQQLSAEMAMKDIPDSRIEPTLLTEEPKRGRGRRSAGRTSRADKADGSDSAMRPPEQLLLRWVNHLLRNSALLPTKRVVSNFGSDWQDGECFVILLNQLAPSVCGLNPLQEGHHLRRAEHVMECAVKLRLPFVPSPADVLEGKSAPIFFFLACLFRCYACRTFAKQEHLAVEQMSKILDTEAASPPASPKAADAPAAAKSAEEEADAADTVVTLDTLDQHLALNTERLEEVKANHASAVALNESWLKLVGVVEDEVADLSRTKALGREAEIRDPRELVKYARLQKTRFKDVASAYSIGAQQLAAPHVAPVAFDTMLEAIQKTIRQHFGDLRRIFSFYAGISGSGATMGHAEFWKFCSDVRAVNRDTLTRHNINKIFQKANADSPGIVSDSSEEGDEDDQNPDSELIPSEFVECLIRMADARVTSEPGLHTRFEMFLNDSVIPRAARSDMAKFRKEVYEVEVQMVLRRYAPELQKIFRFYASQDKKNSVARRTRTIAASEFVALLRDANLLMPPLDEKAVAVIFSAMQGQQGSDDAADVSRNDEAVYHEFAESLVAVAVYKFPTPYTPLDNRVEHLLSAHLLPTLRQRLKLHGVKIDPDVKPVALISVFQGVDAGRKTDVLSPLSTTSR
eukprot:TRINITY_DN1288_c0_g2_i1.p1 TRINITY_DN1288_c0_g2~~TRINITY_DN1288_c0_g2_i1.p1  ORF type:complete len:1152 (+),score=346.05 TRINITY_DN1288_c0_g2_i1:496-3456(+)